MEEQWINKIRQQMENHKEPEPLGLWDDIEKTMDQQRPRPVPMHKRVMMWTAGIGAAAAAIIAIALFIGNDNPKSLTPIYPHQPQLAMEQEQAEQTSPVLAKAIEPETKSYMAINSSVSTQKSAQAISNRRTSVVIEDDKHTPLEIVAQEEQPQKEVAPKPQKRKAVRSPQNSPRQRPLLSSRQQLDLQKKAPHISAGVYAANLPHSSERLNDYSEFVAGNTLPEDLSPQHSVRNTPVRDIIYSNIGKKIQTRKKHKLPVKFGLSFRYRFNDRWSLESGLTYTYLSADLTAGTATHYYNSEQRLQYLGIPVNVNFDFWKNRHWNFYASAGGSIDKCIHGQLDTDFVLNNQLAFSENKSIMEKPVQFSVNGALGAQWNITDNFGIYAEPGVAYYFDNGSPIETIYKDKPFNFNFKLGVRLTFD